MEAILKNSTNSTINTSQVSNPSTARLLIDHIKRLVEDDMKSTVEAFKLIESEIDVELSSTFPKKMFARNRISKSRSCTSSHRQNKGEKRNSLQPSYCFPTTTSSKRSSRKSLISNSLPDSHFESDKIEESTNYGSYDHPHSEQEKLPPWHFEENGSTPGATSTPIKSPFSFPSIDENGVIRSERSESTVTNPYNYRGYNDYQSQSYSDNSKLLTVEAMYQDLKSDLNRILQRFAQDSNKLNTPTATTISNIYDDTPRSLSCGETQTSSFGTTHRSTATNGRCAKGVNLPQLLAFGDNRNNNNNRKNDNGKGVTIISEPFPWSDSEDNVDERTEKMKETRGLWSSKENVSEGIEKLNASNNCIEITEVQEKCYETKNSNITSQKPTDSEGEIITTVDLNVLPENDVNNTNNYVTLTDIEESIPETTRDDVMTNTISSSLIFTPKTLKEPSNGCTDLDEVALLISQASPDRRVIIKKIVPEVAIKGYNKNCDEKLIFSGDKVTHVKTDRKVICRKYIPK